MLKKSSFKLFYSKNSHLRSYSQRSESKWQSVVGLEVHAQINSASKLFSGASTQFSSPANNNVSIFDCSIPGTLPVLNKKCVQHGVLTALALNCLINPVSLFDRKHYFYADMPTGYQITQQRCPLAVNGGLQFHVFTPGVHKNPYKKSVRIKQLQLEQDSGKSLHDEDRSLVDLNRAGNPLMELVFEPDLADGEEAAALVKELVSILLRIKTCTCKMEEGALRVDANVSVHLPGDPFGTRTEIKNIGSIRGVAGAVKYEIDRQIRVKEAGGEITNETRAWDAPTKTTIPMRDKEQFQDYRYMPEPNLPPLHVAMGLARQGQVNVDELKQTLPELPEETRRRLRASFGLSLEQAVILVNDSSLLELYETTLEKGGFDGKLVANLLINDYMTLVHKSNLEVDEIEFDADFLKEIVELLASEDISRNTGRLLLAEIISGNKTSPKKMVEERDWTQIRNEDELRKLCTSILEENQDMVEQYQSGKVKILKAFLGIIANKSKQRADMAKCSVILKELLKKK